jgi:hypothetical protein
MIGDALEEILIGKREIFKPKKNKPNTGFEASSTETV